MGVPYIHNSAIKFLRLLLTMIRTSKLMAVAKMLSYLSNVSPAGMNYSQTSLSQTEEIHRLPLGRLVSDISSCETNRNAPLIYKKDRIVNPRQNYCDKGRSTSWQSRNYVRLLGSAHLYAHEAFIDCYSLHTEDNFVI